MNKETQLYIYEGPVYSFNKMITSTWSAKTSAVSPARARANLEYRFKMQAGLLPTAKISLPGKIIPIE